MGASHPVGVFDSGVGGLSVLREIRRQLPSEHLLYVADSAFAPYGNKPQEFIEARSLAIVEFLLSLNAKAIVVACNTATGAAAATIRARHALPVVAMEPAIKPAAALTRSGVVGVLATQRTLASHNFVKLFERYGNGVEILAQACPGLVEQVEAGDLAGSGTRRLLERYLSPLLAKGADTLVLGCTHYPFLRPLIQKMAGPDVAVIDSSEAVARQLWRRLEAHGLLASPEQKGTEQFWSSADPASAAPILRQLWPLCNEVRRLPEADAEETAEAGNNFFHGGPNQWKKTF